MTWTLFFGCLNVGNCFCSYQLCANENFLNDLKTWGLKYIANTVEIGYHGPNNAEKSESDNVSSVCAFETLI